MDVERAKAMYEMGESLRGIARIMEVCRGRLAAALVDAGVELRPRVPPPKVPHKVFLGRKYRLSNEGRWKATTWPHTYLHRDVYEHFNGPIPEGWEVHHKDHDKSNNERSNLTAKPKDEHAKHHHYKTREGL